MLEEDGEIPFLDADPLDAGMASFDDSPEPSPDERALQNIISELRKKGGRSEESLEEIAVTLYNKVCESIRTKQASDEQVRRAAALFGEEPAGLVSRLESSD